MGPQKLVFLQSSSGLEGRGGEQSACGDTGGQTGNLPQQPRTGDGRDEVEWQGPGRQIRPCLWLLSCGAWETRQRGQMTPGVGAWVTGRWLLLVFRKAFSWEQIQPFSINKTQGFSKRMMGELLDKLFPGNTSWTSDVRNRPLILMSFWEQSTQPWDPDPPCLLTVLTRTWRLPVVSRGMNECNLYVFKNKFFSVSLRLTILRFCI